MLYFIQKFSIKEPKEEDVNALKEKLQYLDDYLGKDKNTDDALFLAGDKPTIADLSMGMLV